MKHFLSMADIEESVKKKIYGSYACPHCGFRFDNFWSGMDLEKTPWAFVPDDCMAIRIYPDGSWTTHEHYPMCQGVWKNCPKELRPQNGGEYVVHRRPIK